MNHKAMTQPPTCLSTRCPAVLAPSMDFGWAVHVGVEQATGAGRRGVPCGRARSSTG